MAARLTAYLVVAIVAVTFIAGLIVGAQRDDSDGPVDLILENATVYTADRRGAMAEAVAIRGNQILKVGSNREISRLRRPQTVVVDARGGAVVPGFNDAYVRLLAGGLTLASLDLEGASTPSETLARIEAWSAAHRTSAWVVGRGWSPDTFRNGLPSRQLLDSVVPNRPAVMYGLDENTIWVNSEALRLAGITRRTADPVDGEIVRDPRRKEPVGVLRGTAVELVSQHIPAPSREERVVALKAAVAEANALGITSVQTIDDGDVLEVYDEMRRSGELTVRIYSAVPVTAPLTDLDVARLELVRKQYPDDPVFKAGALSFRLDGPVATRAAALLEPYEGVALATGDAEAMLFNPDDLNRSFRLADAAGWQVIAHASGDRAARLALNAYAHAARSNRAPARGRRHRIEGLSLVDPADISRFAPLGIIGSMRPSSAAPTPLRIETLRRQLGEERAARTFAFRSIGKATRLTFGSAWPAYGLSPLLGIHIAATQSTIEDTPDEGWHPAERVQLKTAIDAYTSGAAWASFDEQRKGSISPGMLADLVVLSEDIFEAEQPNLRTTTVAATIFDGKIVYRRSPRSETEPVPSLQH
jgi:predicted amidohydrolase YtcJ